MPSVPLTHAIQQVYKASGPVLCMKAQVIQPHLTWVADSKEREEVRKEFEEIDKALNELQDVVTKMLVEVGIMRLQVHIVKETMDK